MDDTAVIAREITRKGSKQTYYTTRLMVDRDFVDDSRRAYAYFRWVDDYVDAVAQTSEERMAFIDRQNHIVDQLYDGGPPDDLCLEEKIMADLLQHNHALHPGLRSFIDNFMAILKFDAERKGRLINQEELDWYSDRIGISVTDCIQYFIHNGHNYPKAENQYLAATAAHITHMLRDMFEDLSNGFINIPRECLEKYGLRPEEVENPAFRDWVQRRVEKARKYFYEGKKYLDELDVLRCKIVGYWYCARFEIILDAIERDGYLLRSTYEERNKISTWLRMVWLSFKITIRHFTQRLRTI